jgi:DhnA family fructose-bisphosphate aldolase class Ia
MDGLAHRNRRLFQNGTLFLAALDHGQYVGVPAGLVDLPRFVRGIDGDPFDGYILNPGAVLALEPLDPSKLLILRISHAGTLLSNTGLEHRCYLAPQDALRLGADAVIIMAILGQDGDAQALHELATATAEYHRYGIPVIAEMLLSDPQESRRTSSVAGACRIGAELGADIIKTPLVEDFGEVVRGCFAPIILAGGPKNTNARSLVEQGVAAGARGIAVGRNLYEGGDAHALAVDLAAALGRQPA